MRKEDFVEWLFFFINIENKDIYWKNVREKLLVGEVCMFFYYVCDKDEIIRYIYIVKVIFKLIKIMLFFII